VVELEEEEINGYPPELKQVDSLPEYAQHIYKKEHARAVEQYQNPAKRRGGKNEVRNRSQVR
jgi:cation transport regulator ChaB